MVEAWGEELQLQVGVREQAETSCCLWEKNKAR